MKFDTVFSDLCAKALENQAADIWTDIARNSDKRPLIIYGGGGNCEFACYCCDCYGVEVTCVCDSSKIGVYDYRGLRQHKIIGPDVLLRDYSNARILISTWNFEKEIKESLLELGLAETQIYYLRYWQRIQSTEFTAKHLDGYRWAWDFFDEHSRKKIADRIRLYLYGIPLKPDSLYENGYFAFPDIKLSDNEVFVDGGAYIGDTVEEFISAVEGKFKAIYAFEPDNENYRIAAESCSLTNVSFIDKGLWSCEKELSFTSQKNAEHIGSKLSDSETDIMKAMNEAYAVSVPVISLDAVFASKSDEDLPTLIKMDIEGAEREALLGSADIIRRKKPKLVICAYHKPEDIYALPQTILKIRDDYKFSLWQIGESFWDLILYAI